jgi:hypothetical protein
MFQISPLPRTQFQHLFGLPDDVLAQRGIVARVSETSRGMPCRVSLRDARAGERALLLNHEHQPAPGPYRSSYAIYVIDGAEEARLEPGELPLVFRGRPLAARGFGADGLLRDARMADGEAIRSAIDTLLDRADVAYVHIHNAMHGCYSARADRI